MGQVATRGPESQLGSREVGARRKTVDVFESAQFHPCVPARLGSGCGTGGQGYGGEGCYRAHGQTGWLMVGQVVGGHWEAGLGVREKAPTWTCGGSALSPSYCLQSFCRKVTPASPTRKDGWATHWTPSAASAGHFWKPAAWRRRHLPFTQVPTVGPLGRNGTFPLSPPQPSTPRKWGHTLILGQVSTLGHMPWPVPGANRLRFS